LDLITESEQLKKRLFFSQNNYAMHTITTTKQNAFSQDNNNLIEKFVTKCSNKCIIPPLWATKLNIFFTELNRKKDFQNIQQYLIESEKCSNCQGDYSVCTDFTKCNDIFNLLANTAKHYKHLRTILRRLYEFRELHIKIILIIDLIANGQLAIFSDEMFDIEVLDAQNNNTKNNPIEPQYNIFEHMHKYQKVVREFQLDLAMKLDLNVCASCKKIYQNRYLAKIPKKISTGQRKILNLLFPDGFDERTKLCRNFCLTDIFSDEIVPKYSHLNNMFLSQTPEVLKSLNLWERMLIQRAKVFLTIIRLKGYNKSKYVKGLVALKGLAIHLPLTLEQTNQYVVDTLPNYNALNVLISSMPSKNNNIWRSLVSLQKVHNAAIWLKNNNKQYQDITINNPSMIPVYGMLHFSKNKENQAKNNESEAYVKINNNQEPNLKQYTVCDFDKINVNISDINKYIGKRVVGNPLYNNDKNLDHWSFPDIFPYGVGGMYDERAHVVKNAMYARWAIFNENPTARRNIQYIFSLVHNKDIRAADSGIFASMNTCKGNLNAKQFLNNIETHNDELDKKLFTTMSAVRNSKEYWAKTSSKLAALNQHFGPAHLYGTLSPAEYHWEELFLLLKSRCQDLTNIESLTLCELIEIEPVFVAWFFEQKFQSIFNKIILNKNGPLGKVKAFFWRREYQCRGAPHIHYKLWIDGAPIYGVDSNEEVIKFIDQTITCRIPDPKKEPKLYEYVMKYQIHRCTQSCTRSSNRRGIISSFCRYGFPRIVSEQTTLNNIEDTLKSRVSGRGVKKLYNIRRTKEEEYVNDYSPVVANEWGGNNDMQYIGEQSMVLDRYITTYITKAEKQATKEVWDSCKKNASLKSQLKSFAVQNFKSREAGIYEVADKLLGIPMHEFSHKVQWICPQPKEKRLKRVRPVKQIKELNENDENIFFNSIIDDYYPNRPDVFDNMSLFELFSWYEYKTKACVASHKNCHKLNNNLGFLHKRLEAKVIQIPNIKCTSTESIELHFFQTLMLFKPWRNEAELIQHQSYTETFNIIAKNKHDNFDFTNFEKFDANKKRTENAQKRAEEIIRLEKENEKKIPTEQNNNANEIAVLEYNMHKVNLDEVEVHLQKLNACQRLVYNKVIECITHIATHQRNICKCGSSPQPLRLFCSGVAGKLKKNSLIALY
jgi:hypothetical protein